ncbi:MAG: ABC transporter permease [Terracidiphilus sp.]
MRKLRAFWIRLYVMFATRHANDEFDAELRSHLAEHIDEGRCAGLSETEARRQALLRVGGAEQVRQAYRDRATLPWLESSLREVRYALRGFRRSPVFAITAILTLALGIGATAAVFSVVDRILFRSLPYAHDDRLVSFGLVQSLERQEFQLGGFFYEWKRNQTPFASVTFERGTSECNLTEANPVPLQCADVAQNFLPTLGISPLRGRNFLPEEDLPNGPKAALISDALWRDRYNRDPDVLNKTIDIDGHSARIVGVLPNNFEMPRLQKADIVRPAQMDEAFQHTANSGIGFPVWAFARLKPGVSVEQAKAEMQPLFLHTQQWIPPEIRKDFHLQVRSIRDRQMRDAYRAAWLLVGAVLLVLSIACANVVSLFSARGAARERELSVRAALGASRGRLIRQTLTEALLLSIAGAAVGCVLAEALLLTFIRLAPTGVPFLAEARLDLRIVSFTIAVSILCAGVFGILPALERPNASALVARQSKSAAHARLRRVLVVSQVGLSVVLLSFASLLVKSFRNLQQVNLGMQTRNVLTVHVPLNWERYTSGYQDFYLRAETAFREIPGVTTVGMSNSVPPGGDSWQGGFRYSELSVAGKPPTPDGVGGSVVCRVVTPDYFRALQIPILEGRNFSEMERSSKENPVILSRDLANRLFPQGDAIGKHVEQAEFRPYRVPGPVYNVIGVAANVKNGGLAGEDDPELYQLRTNLHPETWDQHHFFLLETSLPASVIAPWIRSKVAQLDPVAPVEINTLSETVSTLADRPRFETALLSFFAATGLMMAIIGLYGVVSFMAVQRTQEIGIRMALGATRADISRLILGQGLRLVLVGGAIGLAAALVLSRVLQSMLFGVSPRDPLSFAAVSVLLALVAFLAILIPARSAMKTDPMKALRWE